MEFSFSPILTFLNDLTYKDFLDLFLVWLVVYRVLMLTTRSGALQILTGVGVLASLYALSIVFQFRTFHWLLEQFFSHLFLITIVLFQSEIRRALAQLGAQLYPGNRHRAEERHVIEELVKGSFDLADKATGALIVVERQMTLDYFIQKGVNLDSRISSELLNSVFLPSSPLHDGALIIRGTRALMANSFLPLTSNPNVALKLGTRHRAALGVTEQTDAVALVVSQENCSVSLVEGGNILFDLNPDALKEHLARIYDVNSNTEAESTTEDTDKSKTPL